MIPILSIMVLVLYAKVRDYLAVGPEKLLGRMFNKCLGEKYGYLPGELNF